MRVDGPNHLAAVNAARAYGMRVDASKNSAAIASIRPVTQHAQAAEAGTTRGRMDSLVAARVSHVATLPAPAQAPAAANGSPLPMYRRAADRIEAATAIEVGRMIDVTG